MPLVKIISGLSRRAAAKTAKPKSRRIRALRFLWLLLLPLPPMVGYAESGDPLKTMTEISNRAAKGDRLPIPHPVEAAWTSCAPRQSASQSPQCAALGQID